MPNLFILCGAGLSQESGLVTFRDAGGLWQRVRLEDVATPEAFARDPALVHAFYNARRARLLEAAVQPNAAHLALARLERAWTARGLGDALLVTQNIDDLHERAGSRHALHMHGELLKARCLRCETVQPWRTDLATATACPSCGATSGMRPQVVWFNEIPLGMDRIGAALEGCDVFASIGTSGSVYPAAGFIAAVRGRARTVELNLEPSAGSALFDEARHGPATQLVPAFVEELLAACAP